jgi:hypothetical protein
MVIVFEMFARLVVSFMLILTAAVMNVMCRRITSGAFAFLLVVFVMLSLSGTVAFSIMIGMLRSVVRRFLWADP